MSPLAHGLLGRSLSQTLVIELTSFSLQDMKSLKRLHFLSLMVGFRLTDPIAPSLRPGAKIQAGLLSKVDSLSMQE